MSLLTPQGAWRCSVAPHPEKRRITRHRVQKLHAITPAGGLPRAAVLLPDCSASSHPPSREPQTARHLRAALNPTKGGGESELGWYLRWPLVRFHRSPDTTNLSAQIDHERERNSRAHRPVLEENGAQSGRAGLGEPGTVAFGVRSSKGCAAVPNVFAIARCRSRRCVDGSDANRSDADGCDTDRRRGRARGEGHTLKAPVASEKKRPGLFLVIPVGTCRCAA